MPPSVSVSADQAPHVVVTETGIATYLAESPVAVVVFVVAWASSGLVAAYVLYRRGHELRSTAVLGAVFGPLFIGLARTMARDREDAVPLVLSPGRPGDGPVDILVGFDTHNADDGRVRSVLALFAGRVGRVALAHRIDFQSAADDDWSDAKRPAACALDAQAEALPDCEPAKVLVPGPTGMSFLRYAAREGYDIVVLADGWQSGLLRGRRRTPIAAGLTVVIPPEDPMVDLAARPPRVRHSAPVARRP